MHPHIQIKASHAQDAVLCKVLHALYPQESIEWIQKPDLKKIDRYVLFYLCPYGAKEGPLLIKGLQRAQQLLKSDLLKPDAHILIIFYRDIQVDFPERKLQREKFMSNMITEEIINRENTIDKQRIHVTHEFSPHHLQDTLEELKGSHFYFEVNFL